MVDLRNDIKNILERGKGFEIDKKTLKRIVDKLKRDKLVNTVDFLVTLQQAEGTGSQNIVKTLVLDPDLDPNEANLMSNPTIANPTNRQSSQFQAKKPLLPTSAPSYSLRDRSKRIKYVEKDESDLEEDLSL